MASTLTNLGYNATGKVYNAMSSRMPSVSVNPIPMVRKAATDKMQSMVPFTWTGLYETWSPNWAKYMYAGSDSDGDTVEEDSACDPKDIKSTRKRTNLQLQVNDSDNKLCDTKAPQKTSVEKIIIYSRTIINNIIKINQSAVGLVAMAMIIGAALIGLAAISVLVTIVEITMVTMAFGGVMMVVVSVVLVAIFCLVLMLYQFFKIKQRMNI